MEKPFLALFCAGFVLLDAVRGFPVEYSSLNSEGPNSLWLTSYFITVFGFLLTVIAIILGCVCCRNGKGFKEFSNSSGSLATTRPEGFVNPTANAELMIFPPAGVNAGQICRFEPLPDFKPQTPNLRPAAFSCSEREISSQDWFSEPYNNFPRNQLRYVEEYGRGWFGRVVEGEAQNIIPKEKLTKVMVKILHEDATPTDQMYFLHEVKFYKDLKHPNILRLLGRCLETEPFLIILECYPNGDLKTFLSQNMASARALVEQGVTLQMSANIASGLQYMHKNKFIHTDLAARNCLVAPDLTVKIGDYGNSIENFKSDYYCAGSVALPIRWCAPETLKCTDVTIETREVTPPANIWSLAVVFWEICEFCKLPYSELNDDQVIVRVLGDKNYFLEKPAMFCLHKEEMYHLMKLCWNPPLQRPSASQLQVILENLISSGKSGVKDPKRMSQDFEQRWQSLKPNHIPKKDEAGEDQNVGCIGISGMLKNAKVVDSSYVESPLGVFMSNKGSGQESPRFCLKSNNSRPPKLNEAEENEEKRLDDGTKPEKTEFELNEETRLPESLNPNDKFKNAEADVDSWLKGVEINNEEDESFVRKISEAIRDLDAALALEKTSSSEEESGKSSRQNSPGKDGVKENNSQMVVDFKLGSDVPSFMNFTQKSFELSSLQNSEQPQSLNFKDPYLGAGGKKESSDNSEKDSSFFDIKGYRFDESLKENDSLVGGQSRHSSDTDDEIWRKRIEKGEISEKVKEKSKSIANLMILTHIDASDDSDTDFDNRGFDFKTPIRSSFSRRSGSFAKNSLSSNIFGSENDITNAVLADDFKESIRKLSNDHREYGRFDSLGMIMPSLAGRENAWENLLKNSSPTEEDGTSSEPRQSFVNNKGKLETSVVTPSPEQPATVFLAENKNKQNNPEKSNNFLGNVASEKLLDNNETKEDNDGGSIDMEKSATSDYFSEKEDNLVQLKCDNACSTDSSTSSKRNSSQLNEDIFEAEGNEGSERMLSLSPEVESLEHDEEKCLVGDLKSRNIKVDFDEKSKVDDESYNEKILLKSHCDEVVEKPSKDSLGVSVSMSVPEIWVEEAKENVESPEETFEFPEVKIKPFRFVLKDQGVVPEITVTQEPEDVLKKTEEQIELKFQTKPFKFVFKNENDIKKNEEKINIDDSKSGSWSPMIPENTGSNEDIDSETRTVIMGPSEEFTLDYFKGLKTTSNEIPEVLEIDDKTDWNQHLEKALIQQINGKDFEDITFESLGSCDPVENFTGKHEEKNDCSLHMLADFLESEKIYADKMASDLYDMNRLTGNEEEDENFKFRTPDDERSSDSGFRDKGSLSESVEDACEGKYNLEDIEAELEESYVKKGFVFGDGDKETDVDGDEGEGEEGAVKGVNNSNNFEYEESKFYEDENKNEEDFSDIEGEIEFWQNKDGSDYYPEISEFNPTCSKGWYLHPPEEQSLTYDRTMNEDLVNALRNELRENLPVPTRSFSEFNEDFQNSPFEDPKRELCFHNAIDFSIPLSPIIEEHDPTTGEMSKKNNRNPFFDGMTTPKPMRKNMTNLMESVKSIDTNTFMQYLDYMVENEGRDLDELDDIYIKGEENLVATEATPCENIKNQAETIESSINDRRDKENGNLEFEDKNQSKATEEVAEDSEKAEVDDLFLDAERLKNSILDGNMMDSLEGEEGLIFGEALSPDQERSLSDISNGTRTGDALSEITLSSPDLVPDCFLSAGSQNYETNEGGDTFPGDDDRENIADDTESAATFTILDQKTEKEALSGNGPEEDNSEYTEPSDDTKFYSAADEENDLYEMSTSFMGCDEDDDDDGCEEKKDDKKPSVNIDKEAIYEDKLLEMPDEKQNENQGKEMDDGFIPDWESDSSLAEETSSSSGEFIWKDGDKVSKLKAIDAKSCDIEKVFGGTNIEKIVTREGKTGQGEKVDETDVLSVQEEDDEDDNESSTGSSASITDFVPSAWNSQAMPGRSALKVSNQDSSIVQKKKSVWFKKQKYHCVYEYPREPSDNEDGDSFNQFSSIDNSNKHFFFGVNTLELPNKHFPYGISNVIDYSTCADWDVLEGPDGDLSLTDTESDVGLGKPTGSSMKNSNFNFYNLNPFDYDFNSTGNLSNGSEFFVSSSSRPFQTGSTFSVFSGTNQTRLDELKNLNKNDSGESDEASDSRDFTTPDSGLEDSANVSPLEKKPGTGSPENSLLLNMGNMEKAKKSTGTNFENLRFDFAPDVVEEEIGKLVLENANKEMRTTGNGSLGENLTPMSPLSPTGLGELRHARDRLKLDLPFNHNAEMGAMRNKKINRIH